jgi:GNAT superfamily N-acetyltransferase
MIKFKDLGPDDPKPTVLAKFAIDLTPAELARCRELSFGDEGYMTEDIEHILQTERRSNYRKSIAILLSDPDRAWPINGWALLQPIYRRSRYSAQFFVDPGQRGKGYGRLLLERANKISARPLCYVDDDNRGFFEKHPWYYENYEEKADV